MSKRTIKVCSVSGCESTYRVTRKLCSRHYQRWLKYGDPTKSEFSIYETPEESFAARTEWQGDCLIWTGYKNPGGYGRIYIGSRAILVHRWIWEKTNGSIPGNLVLDHICHNRLCVNVSHLRISTQTNNTYYRSGSNRNSVTGVRNVSRSGNKFTVRIGKERKQFYFGTYESLDEAAKVAEKARQELFGDYAGKA